MQVACLQNVIQYGLLINIQAQFTEVKQQFKVLVSI